MFQEYLLALGKNAPFVVMAVLGLGWLAGQLGAKGKLQLAIAFICGAVIGGAFQIAEVGMPATFTQWFYVGITSIITGLTPSGFYEVLKEGSTKALSWWLSSKVEHQLDMNKPDAG